MITTGFTRPTQQYNWRQSSNLTHRQAMVLNALASMPSGTFGRVHVNPTKPTQDSNVFVRPYLIHSRIFDHRISYDDENLVIGVYRKTDENSERFIDFHMSRLEDLARIGHATVEVKTLPRSECSNNRHATDNYLIMGFKVPMKLSQGSHIPYEYKEGLYRHYQAVPDFD